MEDDERKADTARIRAALVKLYPAKGFDQMDEDILLGSVVWATMSSPKVLTLEEAIQVLERVATRGIE